MSQLLSPASTPPKPQPRLEIDWTRCDAHGLCAALLPERIQLDEWGFPVLAGGGLDPELVGHARRAVLACPALALRLETA
ncbi:MAG: ferredoxin [Sporichthyaceae bacterium]